MEKHFLVKIQNHDKEVILTFLTEEARNSMKEAILNCVIEPNEYPSISYSDSKDDILFSAEYLKQSLIIYPKVL